MDRRHFLKGTALLTGALSLDPLDLFGKESESDVVFRGKKAKNIIFMISDGMSSGTLSMANIYSRNVLGKESHWMDLYHQNKVSRALMDTASASSIVTDSAAASSAFGGGKRVKNGSLNVNENGEFNLPIWQKFKKKGKKAGCVTTVTITHATPAGFCINSPKRNAEPEIAEMYADFGFDVLMGGGDEFFNPEKREDKKDVYAKYAQKGYQIVKDKASLQNLEKEKPVLGIFNSGALPYSIDKNNTQALNTKPSLAEMAKAAIDQMKSHKKGFVLQIEAGKVDWAAHANDIAGLIHDQLAFDEAIKVVMDFAEKDKQTLVIITTDHGNANPGIIYGADATKNFESISHYKFTNEFVLNNIKPNFNLQQIKDWIYENNRISIADEDANHLLNFYKGLEKSESGLYNYKNLPYKAFSDIQKKHNNVGWISMDHSADHVELAMYGPGSQLLKPFVKNTDLHNLMLEAAEVENQF
ncbi:alkaline phosphatase [Chryseobacterium indologenes]|uniref:Alkaline phosphatase n=1 Tax=Chryseobacterium oryzae TaxID=2929799 RepID=A0ABY4BIC3_9FLAO|nr:MULTISPECIES: alkaline phosphatase [Chryseobacterium]AYZ35174.1 alkaline phosphatase [Chryseobacterium indologenes]MEB4762893.1 alkaline phosphatase [Chryseobacterium indologenes]UEQ78079.1 alkaline phosphatase [Chryseobacterium arthrosphaerae]UOE37483.1 alkaline phosphatase [Chryseobacterium oryzae]VXC32478.1 Alkaline phosphatase [Chryseobacterium sp. 8AT]